jgi:hypothetical protein
MTGDNYTSQHKRRSRKRDGGIGYESVYTPWFHHSEQDRPPWGQDILPALHSTAVLAAWLADNALSSIINYAQFRITTRGHAILTSRRLFSSGIQLALELILVNHYWKRPTVYKGLWNGIPVRRIGNIILSPQTISYTANCPCTTMTHVRGECRTCVNYEYER